MALVLGELPAPPPPGAAALPAEPASGRVPGDPIGVVGAGNGHGRMPRPEAGPRSGGSGRCPARSPVVQRGCDGVGERPRSRPEGDPAGGPVGARGRGAATPRSRGPAGGPVRGRGRAVLRGPAVVRWCWAGRRSRRGEPRPTPAGPYAGTGRPTPGLARRAAALMPDGVPAWRGCRGAAPPPRLGRAGGRAGAVVGGAAVADDLQRRARHARRPAARRRAAPGEGSGARSSRSAPTRAAAASASPATPSSSTR